MQKIVLITALSFLGLLSCIQLPEEPEEFQRELNIYSILVPNKQKQVVIVDRTFSMEDGSSERVSGADVKISHGDLTVYFREDSVGYYSDTLGVFWVMPGSTYQLEVTYDDDTVRAVTTIPDTFRILSPGNNDTIPVNSLLKWSPCKNIGDREYFIDAIPVNNNSPDLPEIAASDTVILLNHWIQFNPLGMYTVLVYVMNQDYYDNSMNIGNNFRSGNINGGTGLFGAESIAALNVFFREE